MADKQLKDKAVKIKGKDYVLVSDRVLYFNEQYENGCINTTYDRIGDTWVVKAYVKPDADKPQSFTGLSQATIGDGMVNRTAALENAETSAVGRALAMMGIGVIESIASADEMNKAGVSTGSAKATEKQLKTIYDTVSRITGMDNKEDMDAWLEEKTGVTPGKLSTKAASAVIGKLFAAEKEAKQEPAELDEVVTDIPDNINLDDIPY